MTKNVYELRKSGKLNYAWKIAFAQYKQNKNNTAYRINLAWVYYDLLKRELNKNNLKGFVKVCEKLVEISPIKTDKLLTEQFAWVFYKMIKQQNVKANFTYNQIETLMHFYSQIVGWSTPRHAQSLILLLLLKITTAGNKWWRFIPELDNNLFRSEDRLPQTFNGKQIMPLKERVFYAYIKSLISDTQNNNPIALEKLSTLIIQTIQSPEFNKYDFFNYYMASALKTVNRNTEARNFALKFVRNSYTKSWAWKLLADCEPENQNRLNFLVYALTLEKKETFLLSVRQSLSIELIKNGYYYAAKQNLDIILKIRTANNWAISQQLKNLTSEQWYIKPNDTTTIKQITEKIWLPALKAVFPNIRKEKALITNTTAKKIRMITPRGKILYYKKDNRFVPGDTILVYHEDTKVFRIQNVSNNEIDVDYFKRFEGELKVKTGFGFVNNIYIPEKLIQNKRLENGNICRGYALKTINKKKNKEGWKAVYLEKNT